MGKYKRRMRFVAGADSYFTYALPVTGGVVTDVLSQAGELIAAMKEELF
jgi:hypothetical protein